MDNNWLVLDIILKLSEANLKIVGAKIMNVKRELAEKHYHRLKKEQIAKHGEEKGNRKRAGFRRHLSSCG